MAAKSADDDRKAKLDQMRKQQKSSDRRRLTLVIVATGVVVVTLIALVVVAIVGSREENTLATAGAPSSDAGCGEVEEDETTGVSNHVGPGTNTPQTTRVEYTTVPPTSGAHFNQPQYPAAPFYTAEDRPPMENLVHNLEHGYTVVWYDESLPAEQVETLQRIGSLAQREVNTDKFIVSAWDDSYGEMPEETPIAMSHWGADTGYRQMCEAPSGEAVADFIEAYPSTDSPEPNGA